MTKILMSYFANSPKKFWMSGSVAITTFSSTTTSFFACGDDTSSLVGRYQREQESGYRYTAFYKHYSLWKRRAQPSMHMEHKADEKTTGPASIMLTDPDGNVILVDQHR